MHGQFQQRLLRGHRDSIKHFKRGEDDDDLEGLGEFTLTGPVTLTITKIVSPSPTMSPYISPSGSSSSASVSETVPTAGYYPNYGASDNSSTLSRPSPSSSTSPSSFPSPSIVDANNAGSNNSTGGVQPISGSTKPGSLSFGALVGIILACMAVLIGSVAYGVRRRYVKRRLRLRKEWMSSKGARASLGINPSSYEPKEPYPTSIRSPAVINQSPMQSSGATMVSRPPLLSLAMPVFPTPPAASYGNSTPITPTTSQQGSAMGFLQKKPFSPTTPIYDPPTSALLSPFAANVVATFITSLPDELSLSVGETIRVLAEYDDGWALCLNGRGEQGMVPLECLDRGFAGDPSTRDMGNARRVSSLNPASASGVRRY